MDATQLNDLLWLEPELVLSDMLGIEVDGFCDRPVH